MKKFLSLLLALTLILALCPLSVSAADGVITKATVTKTSIKADYVSNWGGYGSLRIEGVYSTKHSTFTNDDGEEVDYEYVTGVVSRPQVALADKTGKLVFGYRESYNTFYYDADSGIVSLTSGGPYNYTYDSNLVFDKDREEISSNSYPVYYNLDGSVAFSLQKSWAGPVYNGMAIAIDFGDYEAGDYEDHAYVVGKTGAKVFDLPSEFAENTAMGSNYVARKKQIEHFSDGLAMCYEEVYAADYYVNILGYMDAAGKMVLDLSGRGYDNAGRFNDGMTWVSKDGKYGYIDKTGKEVIAPQYEDAYIFSGGLAAVKKNGKYGFIDKTGKTVIPFGYDDTFGAGDGLLTVINNDKCGLINTKNEVIVPLEYDDISTYENGVAYAIKDGCVYIITGDEGASTTPETPTTTGFIDVPADAWYAAPVAWALEKGITNGTGVNKFSPEKTCSTAEILTFLWRACGSPKAEAAGSFTDVASGSWYADAANWAKSKGMVSGSALSPDTPCTRASAVMFIWQAMGKPAASKAASFADVDADADYAAAVAWAVENGVTNGTGTNKFSPDDICTRGHIVTFLQRAYA